MNRSSKSKPLKVSLILTTISLCLWANTLFSTPSDATKLLTLASHSPDSTYHLQRAKAIFGRALAHLGYGLTIRRCEPSLCTHLANHNRVDGELLRVAIYQKRVPTLFMVEEPTLSVTWSAYRLNRTVQVRDWQQIIDSDFRISYLAEIPFLDHHLLGKVPQKRLVKIKHWMAGLNNLRSGKADILISADHVDSTSIENSQQFHFQKTPLSKAVPLYTFLNKKHQQLAKDLAAIMMKMKANGEISAIEQALSIPR